MIRLWIARNASLPIREQLSAQLLLGILSRKLAPGEKLPSVRELARRLKIHGNTVLAAYRDLARRGWVRARGGSGVFVREFKWPTSQGGLDDLVRTWVEDAQKLGYSLADIQAALDRMRPAGFVVMDPDPELARILAAEASEAMGQPVGFASLENLPSGALILAQAGQVDHVARAVGDRPFRVIHVKSMQEVLAGRQRPPFPILIGVVSRSPQIREWAATLLSSLGFDAASVLVRDPADPTFAHGLSMCAVVACNIVAAADLPAGLPAAARPVIFRLLSEESLAELRTLVSS